MKRFYFSIAILLALTGISNTLAQRILVPREPAFVQEEIRKGDDIFAKAEKEGNTMLLSEALPHYLEGRKGLRAPIALLDYRIGLCYLYSYNQDRAIEYMLHAQSEGLKFDDMMMFFFARSFHVNMELDSALRYYQVGASPWNIKMPQQVKEKGAKAIVECKRGKAMMANPRNISMTKMSFNTQHPEYAPVLGDQGRTLYFTARYPEGEGESLQETSGYQDENIYSVAEDFVTAEWMAPRPLSILNNPESSDRMGAITFDDSKQIILKNGFPFYSEKDEYGYWTVPSAKPTARIAKGKHISSMYFSRDGNHIYFTATGKESFGQHDIFMADWDPASHQFVNATNLGIGINTTLDESSVSLSPDNETLYFSSTGWDGIGGYDLYYCTKEKKGWSKPQNMGYPINTASEDLYFIPADTTGRYYYYSGGRIGGYDIYLVDMEPDKPSDRRRDRIKDMELRAKAQREQATKDSLEAIKQETIARSGSVSSLPQQRQEPMTKEIVKIYTQEKTFPSILFRINDDRITREAFVVLRMVVAHMKDHPNAMLTVKGHTDESGEYEYNMALSNRRAQAVKQFLINEGVTSESIETVAYSYIRPITPGKTEEERRLNRRADIVAKHKEIETTKEKIQ